MYWVISYLLGYFFGRDCTRENPLEEEMATHSSILAWKIPWTEGPGGLQSMGSHRVDTQRVQVRTLPLRDPLGPR